MNDSQKNNRKKYFRLTSLISEPLDLLQHLPFQIAVTSNLLQLNRDPEIRDIIELEPRELRIILNIGSYMPLTAANIAYQSRLDSYTVTRAVKKLQTLQLVEQHNSSSNKKEKLLLLTEQGLNIYNKLLNVIADREALLSQGLTQQDKQMLMQLLCKIENNAEKMLATKTQQKTNNNQTISSEQKELIRWHKKSKGNAFEN